MSETYGIVFFDGDCGLCSRSVRFLMEQDEEGSLKYAPLQGSTSASLLDQAMLENLSTVVYRRSDETLFLRSDAILNALIDSGSALDFLARLGLKLPRRLRDAVYDWVAIRRERFFSNNTCGLLDSEHAKRVLP